MAVDSSGKRKGTDGDQYEKLLDVCSRLTSRPEGDDILISDSVFESVSSDERKGCEPVAEMRVRGASPASVTYRVNWRSAETPSALEPENQLKVLWSGSESRISFQSSLERDQTLISYEAHDLDLDKIHENAKEVAETVRLGNLDGSAIEASKTLKNLGQRLFSLVFPKEIRDRIRMSLAAK